MKNILLEGLRDISFKSALRYSPDKTFSELIKELKKHKLKIHIAQKPSNTTWVFHVNYDNRNYKIKIKFNLYGLVTILFDDVEAFKKGVDEFGTIKQLANDIAREFKKTISQISERAAALEKIVNKYKQSNIEIALFSNAITFHDIQNKRDQLLKIPFFEILEFMRKKESKIKNLSVLMKMPHFLETPYLLAYVNRDIVFPKIKAILGDIYDAGFIPDLTKKYFLSFHTPSNNLALMLRIPPLKLNDKKTTKGHVISVVVGSLIKKSKESYRTYIDNLTEFLVQNKKEIIKGLFQ